MSTLIEPVAVEWVEIWGYIRETGEFDLLHRRIANLAVKARWEDGKEIPGVGKQEIFKLSVSGAK
jgi:hypothetical protein